MKKEDVSKQDNQRKIPELKPDKTKIHEGLREGGRKTVVVKSKLP